MILRSVACISVIAGLAAVSAPPVAGLTQSAVEIRSTASIAGRIVDARTGSPVTGANVRLFSLDGQPWPQSGLQGTTDDAGRFLISGVPAGPLRISVNADGYVPGGYGATAPGDSSGNRLVVGSGEKVSDLVISLHPVAGIYGNVVR